MKMLSTYLNQRGLTMIVASLATCWFLSSPEVGSAAAKKSSSAPTQEMTAPGRLVVVRGATLGPTIVGLRVDGVKVAEISYNRRYDAPLAAGSHVVTVYAVNSQDLGKPTDIRVNVASGKTYTFTAVRHDVNMVLR